MTGKVVKPGKRRGVDPWIGVGAVSLGGSRSHSRRSSPCGKTAILSSSRWSPRPRTIHFDSQAIPQT